MKKLTALVLALILVVSLVPAAFAADLTLGGKVVLNVGETTRWTANQWVWWTSGNPGVATIDQTGTIVAVRAGVSNITATAADGTKRNVLITVSSPYPTGIQLAGKTTCYVGNRFKWNATVIPSTAANKAVTWTSGNPGVATVDNNGNIVAHKAGICNITATTANGIKKTVLLTVYNTYHTANSLKLRYVSGTTEYAPKSRPDYVGVRNFVLPYIDIAQDETSIGILFHYCGNEYLYIDEVEVYADGSSVISQELTRVQRTYSHGNQSEYFYLDIPDKNISIINAMANASYAKVTFKGTYGSYTHVISADEKQDFKNALAAYSLMD